MKKLRRRIRITAQGKELYKFINRLHNSELTCLGQYCRNDVFYGEVYAKDIKKVRESAKECDVELKEAEYKTIMSAVHSYRARSGIILGLIAAFVLCVYFSVTVVTIEIQGNSFVTDEAVLAALSELDVKRGTLISSIDMHYCESELRLMVDGISWVGMRHTGNRLVVQVTEITRKPEMLRERVPCNIVSAKDARITSVTVHDGMLMHKIGDFVPKGTLLINGVAEDDTGHITIHHAIGNIIGIYNEEVDFSEEYSPERSIRTGRSMKRHSIRLFSRDIPLYISQNKYTSYDINTTYRPLCIFGSELPLGLITDEISETELRSESYTDEELDRILTEKMYLYEKNFLSDCKLIKRDIRREKTEDSLIFHAVYRVEGNIGEQKDIFIKADTESP